MTARRTTAVVLALAVVFATTGGVGPAPQVSDELAEPTVTVVGGDPSVDPATIYRRVADLQGVEYATLPDVTVTVTNRSDLNVTALAGVTRFERLLGIEPRAPDLALAGLARPGEVYLYTDVATTPAQRERILAHEFAHVVQFHQDAFRRVDDRINGSGANESRLQTAVTEGTARYVEHRYAVEYMDADPGLSTWAEVRANLTQFEGFLIAPYHFGHHYVDGRLDSPTGLPAIYDDPPRTSEQLLHGQAAGSPSELSVRFDGRPIDDRRTKGELFVRLLLEGELGLDRAETAAAGWGNDELAVLEAGEESTDGGSRPNYVWALRWDSPGEADEFEAAIRDYLDAQAGPGEDGIWRTDGTTYRVERVSEETVVVLVGGEEFVETAGVTGTDGEVTVDAAGDGSERTSESSERATAVGGRTAPPRPVTP